MSPSPLIRWVALTLANGFLLLGVFTVLVRAQSDKPPKPEAYLRFHESNGTRRYYVAVYVKAPLVGEIAQIRASLRDQGKDKKLISTNVEQAPAGDDSTFTISLGLSEEEIFKQLTNYKVFVDAYPSTKGVEDYEISPVLDVNISFDARAPQCRKQTSLQVEQVSKTQYGARRFKEITAYLSRPNVEKSVRATLTQPPSPPQPRTVTSVSPPSAGVNTNGLLVTSCIEFGETPPPGDYTLSVSFNESAPPALHYAKLEGDGSGPGVPDATAEERGAQDFLDLGLTLTSSVKEETQPNMTARRVRTTRGVADLFFAPLLNLRTVTAKNEGGTVQVFTPFYIDAKVSTGKITEDTLALNRIELGSTYEFRDYNTKAYADLFRHALSFKHSSDRDFKQDEFKFTYEFQPIFGALNRPLGSAPNIMNEEVVPNTTDQFGLEIVPILGVEIGRTYRVKDPTQFAGVSRNVRRFYFGGSMAFDLTKHVRLELKDLFYVRGENPNDRTENYFVGSLEAPLDWIGKNEGTVRAAHALFFSFERGEQAPFSNPSVNVLKFGYRIRARGLLLR